MCRIELRLLFNIDFIEKGGYSFNYVYSWILYNKKQSIQIYRNRHGILPSTRKICLRVTRLYLTMVIILKAIFTNVGGCNISFIYAKTIDIYIYIEACYKYDSIYNSSMFGHSCLKINIILYS